MIEGTDIILLIHRFPGGLEAHAQKVFASWVDKFYRRKLLLINIPMWNSLLQVKSLYLSFDIK